MKTIIYYFIICVSVFLISCEHSVEDNINNDNKTDCEYENAIKAIQQFSNSTSGRTESSSAELKLNLRSSNMIFYDRENHTNNINKSITQQDTDSIKLFTFDMAIDENEGFAIACANSKSGHVLAYVENGNIADTIFNDGLKITISALPLVSERLARCGYTIDNPDPNGSFWAPLF